MRQNIDHIHLFKTDSQGKIRVWWIETNGVDRYRTHSGILGGKIVQSGWLFPSEKNVGRSNATSVVEQLILEINSEYDKKLAQGKYSYTVDDTKAKFFECMLASKYDPNKNVHFPYFTQPKLDGVRCIVSKNGMQSRQGKPIVSAPHIFEALKPLFEENPDFVLDGELYNHDLKHNFEKIISLARKSKPLGVDLIESKKLIQYHVYDTIMPGLTYDIRLNRLKHYLRNIYQPMIQVVPTYYVNSPEDVSRYLGQWLEQGYEGQMLRVPGSWYEGKRSKNLIKHKEFEDEEFKIVSIEEGKGNWAGAAKRIEIELDDGTTQFSGVRGTFDELKELLYNADQYIGTEVTVRYQNKTEDGKLRFPVIVTFWKGERDV